MPHTHRSSGLFTPSFWACVNLVSQLVGRGFSAPRASSHPKEKPLSALAPFERLCVAPTNRGETHRRELNGWVRTG